MYRSVYIQRDTSYWGPETLSHDLTFAAGRQQSLLTQPQEVCCQGNRERSFKSYALILLLKTDLTGVFFFFWNMMREPRCLLPSAIHCTGMIYACMRVTVVEEDVGPIWKWYKLSLYKMLMICRSALSKLLSAAHFRRAELHQAESKWSLTDFIFSHNNRPFYPHPPKPYFLYYARLVLDPGLLLLLNSSVGSAAVQHCRVLAHSFAQ